MHTRTQRHVKFIYFLLCDFISRSFHIKQPPTNWWSVQVRNETTENHLSRGLEMSQEIAFDVHVILISFLFLTHQRVSGCGRRCRKSRRTLLVRCTWAQLLFVNENLNRSQTQCE